MVTSATYKKNTIENNSIVQAPTDGYWQKHQCSKVSIQWLQWL